MQNISFGRIFKVNVPASIAETAVEVRRRKLYRFDNSGLLGYTQKAHVVQPNDGGIYIFTNKDGEVYWDSYCKAYDHMEWAHDRYGGDELFDIETNWAFKEHADRIEQYLADNKHRIQNMNIRYEQCDYPLGTVIKSIDIQA